MTEQKPLTKEDIREQLANLEHQQWGYWSKNAISQLLDNVEPFGSIEAIGKRALQLHQKWLPNWVIYDELSEELKDKDREWADKVLEIFRPAIQGLLDDEATCESCEDTATEHCKEDHPDFVFYYYGKIKKWLGAILESNTEENNGKRTRT